MSSANDFWYKNSSVVILIEQVEKAVRWESALTFVRDRQANPTKSQLYYTAKRPTPTFNQQVSISPVVEIKIGSLKVWTSHFPELWHHWFFGYLNLSSFHLENLEKLQILDLKSDLHNIEFWWFCNISMTK